MPRNSKYQAPSAPNKQAYGQRGDQMAAQKSMPLPKVDNAIPQGGGAPPSPMSAPAAGGPSAAPEGGDLMAMASQFDPGITPLTDPTQRPGEPVTAGLTQGAGPGPEIFSNPGRARRAAESMELMAQVTGDDEFLRMAERLRSGGGYV